jgi:hypothetical protein
MTTPVATVRPDTPFKQVAVMVRAVGAVPVTTTDGMSLSARLPGLDRAVAALAWALR